MVTQGDVFVALAVHKHQVAVAVAQLLKLVDSKNYRGYWSAALDDGAMANAIIEKCAEQLYTETEKAAAMLRYAVGDRVTVRFLCNTLCGEVYGDGGFSGGVLPRKPTDLRRRWMAL